MPSQRTILGIGLAILLLIGAASIGLDLKSRSDTAAVDHALEVLKRISDMRPLLRSAESAARGFAVSGDADFVREHSEAGAAFQAAFLRLTLRLAVAFVDRMRLMAMCLTTAMFWGP